ncbi:ABC transporter permease [Pseudorhizobium flavum]|uniref:Spermidine/putrescine transport system permease protein n=1 Tax=Pseudorhizobium flavum TaxID=1335061 RepID=A0A7W9Z1C3_9HYPH|nr:ABC transporter permease [Pseudorhizobium flavum]MBB6182235.1 spermidine/putrescine transport system permease protein [Pseudorhizobium flavum]CAD6629380.1 ABC transporter permease [Pseudorhizobium flavum]
MHRILSSFKIFPSIFNFYGLLFLAFLYMPLALIVLYSFNANPINMAVWTGFTFDWYRTIFGGAAVETTFDAAFSESPQRIFEVVKNSFLVAVSASTIATVVGTATAIALARYKFFGKRFYQTLLLLPMLIPDIVLGIALLIFFVGVGFELGLLTIIIGHVTFLSSYVFVVVSARLAGMDTTLEQASADLGAGPFTTFRRVTLPQIMPGVVGGFLLAFIISLDDVVITYFIAGVGSQTLPLFILAMMRRGLRPQITALAVLILVFSFIVATVGLLLRNRKP